MTWLSVESKTEVIAGSERLSSDRWSPLRKRPWDRAWLDR